MGYSCQAIVHRPALTIIAAGFAAKLIFPHESMTYLALMALVLAPTDAALGKDVVTDEQVPEKIRSSINVESGLNDGIVFAILSLTVLRMIPVAISLIGTKFDLSTILFIG